MSGRTSKQSRRVNLVDIAVTLEDGPEHVVQHLDIRRVILVDKDTGEPLFKPLIDAKQVPKQIKDSKG
jgi:hypothetical protein